MIKYHLKENEIIKQEDVQLVHKVIRINESMYLSVTQGGAKKPAIFFYEFENGDPKVAFNFCLNGTVGFYLSGGLPRETATSEFTNVLVIPRTTVNQEFTCSNSLSVLTFYIDARRFVNIVGANIELLPSGFIEPIERNDACYWLNNQWQPIMKVIISQVLNRQFSDWTEKIFIESKTLELIAVMIDHYSGRYRNNSKLSRSNFDRIHYARELLVEDLSNPPCLSDLARMAGTNEFTLKQGFKEIFHVPVFKYLQQQRLTKAYDFFQSTDHSISEIAVLVGYESYSSFTRAFKQYYGISPGGVKRIPFRTI